MLKLTSSGPISYLLGSNGLLELRRYANRELKRDVRGFNIKCLVKTYALLFGLSSWRQSLIMREVKAIEGCLGFFMSFVMR